MTNELAIFYLKNEREEKIDAMSSLEVAKKTCTVIAYDKAIEALEKQIPKPTETSGFKIEKGKVVFYTNILNGYRHEYKDLEEIVKELNLMLQSCYKCDEVVSHYKGNLKTAKTEAIKEFAERLKAISKTDDESIVLCTVDVLDNLVKETTEVQE